MIDAMESFQEWMQDNNISLEDVELSVHFPNEGRRRLFYCTLRAEVDIFTCRKPLPLKPHPEILEIFGTRVHLVLNDDHY